MNENRPALYPLILDSGLELKLSPGKHNKVQVAIVKEFASRFAKNAQLLYLGDTAKKDLYVDVEKLRKIGIPIDQHSKLPDVVIFDVKKNWLFLMTIGGCLMLLWAIPFVGILIPPAAIAGTAWALDRAGLLHFQENAKLK